MLTLSARKLVGLAGLLLLCQFLIINLLDSDFTSQTGTVRVFLAILFPLLIILRRKPEHSDFQRNIQPWLMITLSLTAAVFLVVGLIFDIHQLEWLGLLGLVFFALSLWLPDNYRRDLCLAFLLLYFMHPIPGQLYGGIQRAMQAWSVSGAENLLHAFNVRVWQEGMVIHTGYSIFEVPAACSGMKTAMTVFLSCLGVGVLYRLCLVV